MLFMSKFEYHEPSSVEEACEIISQYKDSASILAGGTDLLVRMKHKAITPKHLISLSRIKELKEVNQSNGTLKVGACYTVSEIV